MKKRIVSMFTSMLLVFSMVSYVPNVNAKADDITEERNGEITTGSGDVSIEGTNSFGNMLTSSLDEKMDEQEANNGYNVFSVEMADTTVAAVEFETLEDCTLVVGIYDEAGEAMLASGSTEVISGETDVYVDIETDSMPEYFYLRAFLVDTECFRPLCAAYESPNYTQEMQEFLQKTTDDFDQDRVLNLDEDKTNNFAVYSEDTKIISQAEGTNEVVSADDENNIYVIENADSSITSLQPGETFAYEYGEGDVLIVKVNTISINGTTVTIKGEETSLEETFDYVKIDTQQETGDAEIDTNGCDDSLEYMGTISENENSRTSTYAIDVDTGASTKLSYKFLGNDEDGPKVTGSFSLGVGVNVKTYISFSYQYIEIAFNSDMKLELAFEDKVEIKIPIGKVTFIPFPGINIGCDLNFLASIAGKISFSATLEYTSIGFSYSSDTGFKNLVKKPNLDIDKEIQAEIKVFIGISLAPNVSLISSKIAKAELDLKAGAEIAAEATLATSSDSVKHDCSICFDGEIAPKVEMGVKLKLLDNSKLSLDIKMLDFKFTSADFYFSVDKKEFGWGGCPYKKYKINITVLDQEADPVENAKVEIDDSIVCNELITNKDGKTSLYLPNGKYKVTVEKNSAKVKRKFAVLDNAKSLPVELSTNNNQSGNDKISTDDCKLSLGMGDSAIITESGNLYMWGSNSRGELGNGTTTDSYTPIKIMDNIKSVSLGSSSSAAITEIGELYTWGDNSDGTLGDGTTIDRYYPIKIMDNVASVSVSSSVSAAITEDGSLYMWGYNNGGRLGNGYGNGIVATPIKILDNVKSVSLGNSHSAAITKDGDLYTWGFNDCGQLGNGTTTDSYTPIKIMDNVKSVSLGSLNSAAITKDGRLYVWGNNDHGEVGNGTTTDMCVPIKIMDNVKSVSLGSISAAITETGELYMWGENYCGLLGNGTTADSYTPMKIMDKVVSFNIGHALAMAITKDGGLYTWGANTNGQLGDGTTSQWVIRSIPAKILDNVKSVSLGNSHSAAITKDGSLYTWGYNGSGQLGNGITTDSSIPIKITIPAATTAISAMSPSVMLFTEMSVRTTKSFSDLKTNEVYNIYAIKSQSAETLLDSDNLLYITQAVSDENGELSVAYGLAEKYDDAVWLAVPMTQTDISSADVALGDLEYTGNEQFVEPVVTFDGEVLAEGKAYYLERDYSATDPGKYTVIITGMGLYTGSIEVSYSVNDVGYDVAGNVTSFGSNEKDLTTITLMTEGNSEPTYSITVGGIGTVKYSIPNVMTGKYTLIISKKNHVTRTYKVSVDDKDIVQDLKIHLIGDINGDGKITISDVAKTTSHIRGKVLLEDYDFAVADINGDGKVTVSDKAKINAHMRGKSSLWK